MSKIRKTLNTCISEISRYIMRNYEFILFCLFFVLSAVMVVISDTLQAKIHFTVYAILIAILWLSRYFISTYKKVTKPHNITLPVLPHRLTTKTDGDQIAIKPSDWHKAIIYLSNIEDYLENTGAAKWI